MNTRYLSILGAAMTLALGAGCVGAAPDDIEGDGGDQPITVAGRVWQVRARAISATQVAASLDREQPGERAAVADAGAEAADPPAVTRGAFLDNGDGRELFGVATAERVRAAVAAYERENPAEGAVPQVSNERSSGGSRVVFGFDGRTRVPVGQLTAPDYRRIVRYEIPGVLSCSGALVGSRYVALAAHCVYNRTADAWIFGPGNNRGRVCVDGACVDVTARKRSPGWASSTNATFRRHDYALLRLRTNLGSVRGTMGLSSVTDHGVLRGMDSRLYGFPAPTPNATPAGANNMWGMHCSIRDVLPNRLAYDCDTSGGQSGAPLYYLNTNGRYYITAVHSGGGQFFNTGPRMSEIRNWFITEMAGW